jgi:putative FmdB family regulatory protein
MPTYVYRCTSCGAGYERRESFAAPTVHDCPECGRLSRRMPVAAALIFKGSGFHKTDSRPSSNGAKATSSETISESKPAEKAETSADGATPARAETKSEATPAASEPPKKPGHGHSHSHGGSTHSH